MITHVAVGKMTEHDGHAVEPALDDVQARGITPESMLGDTHYGSNDVIAKASDRGVELMAPSMPPKGSQQGKYSLEDFELDEEGRMLRCPQGHAPVETHISEKRLQASFDLTLCSGCPMHALCPGSDTRKGGRWQYTHERVRQRARRKREACAAFRDPYRWRAGTEGTMSRLKHQMGMGTLRVRGLGAVTYRVFLCVLGLNIFRVAAWKRRISGTAPRWLHFVCVILTGWIGPVEAVAWDRVNHTKCSSIGDFLPPHQLLTISPGWIPLQGVYESGRPLTRSQIKL